jgi:NAD(P)-dependent dehydrogenase (short-subunit alcohol dehydrogenase family)
MVEKCGRESLIISADLTKMEDIRRIEKESIDRFNHVDILINNAAVSLLKKVDNFTEDDFDLIMNTNLKGSFFLSQLIANKMKRNNGGNIIFITSSLGKTAMRATGLYGASKAALMQITRSMTLEWAEHNIRVNSVSPGPWATGMLEPLFRDMRKMKDTLSRLTPARRLGEEGDIGGAVIFLTSEASRHITGQDLIVDGGFSVCKII